MSAHTDHTPIPSTAHTATWLTLVVLVGLILPAGGFLVTGISRMQRFADTRPALPLMLAVAALVFIVQVAGILALPLTSAGFSSVQLAG